MHRYALVLLIVAMAVPAAHATSDQVTLELHTGDVLHGRIIEATDEQVILEHPVLGRLTIPTAQIVAGPEDAAPAPEPQAETQAAGEVAPEPEPDVKWESNVDVGLNATYGNSEDQSLAIDVGTDRKSPRSHLKLGASYYFATSDGDTTDNEFKFIGNHDWLMPASKWFYFGRGSYEFDEFESYRHRVAGHAGPGYHLIEADDLMVDLKAGLGARKQFVSDNEDVEFEAVAQVIGEWQITDRQTLAFDASIFPVVTDPADYRTLEHVTWRMTLDQDETLNLSFKLGHEYQSEVGPDTEPHDVRLFLGLGYAF
ncbi:MAG: DUF481 domain-containing protein [Planctomycetes bacterium]|nr:DUF481 domain-containing protein [Planctomycetota bacterium]